MVTAGELKKLRACAYCRVSTEEDNQASSHELQAQNYTKMIRENPEWEFDEDEAYVVRTIYSLYLVGYASTQIADLLIKSGIPTVKGLST